MISCLFKRISDSPAVACCGRKIDKNLSVKGTASFTAAIEEFCKVVNNIPSTFSI